tara:strand:- start:3075 stop:3515 length:441 start_codon:yes stop_codon:yes gene_type:complete
MDKKYNKDVKTIKNLTDEQHHITQEGGTEKPFKNKFCDHYEEGLYVDVVSKEPLFSSKDKYNSKSGWPSFVRFIDDHVVEKSDLTHGMVRTEVRSKYGDSHLGHVFPDGPKDKGGLRYCINSASLRFVSVDKLEEEGYGEYLKLFK